MFGNLMNNIEQQQAQMKSKLSGIPVEITNQGIRISGNALRKINNIEIDQNLFESNDKEMLEDLLLAGFNEFIQAASAIEAAEAQQLMSSVLPGGLGDLFK
ncbi:MAG TPA: YbaB/EbfC family nucleoid-associated protein [Saprospiraceae bacterium]|nr:YbaB/EbfC family nucleoid-associated protein [Saprospiraceae bacterium]HRO09802.1 YbaB/EbfC family nucleoid-associated protein [Saprospiraceae bacterium]HRO72617.1 YbaB/EbfC family nucleoid-associated protein [Saprospiraceae bacterium]HRP43057.1 YbaB/EbfC family nucleoid-associated protein [Saprospiraceae bacterium]